MLPGAEWSLVKKGEQVDVLGRLPNGWYRCRALRDVTYKLEKIPSTVEEMNALNDGKGILNKALLCNVPQTWRKCFVVHCKHVMVF